MKLGNTALRLFIAGSSRGKNIVVYVKLVGPTLPNFSKFLFELYPGHVLWFHLGFINSVSQRMTLKIHITCSEVFTTLEGILFKRISIFQCFTVHFSIQ